MTMANSIGAFVSSWVPVARDPLLPLQEQDVSFAAPQQQPVAAGGGSFPWLPTAGFSYLTFISGMALHRCWPDRGDVAFVVSAYLDLLLLFYCLRRYERADPGSLPRKSLKLAVWLLTSALTLLFSYKVAAVMPAAAMALIWLMAFVTISSSFVAFYCFQEKP